MVPARLSRFSEVLPLSEDDRYRLRDLFLFKTEGIGEDGVILGALHPTGLLPTFTEQVKMAGLKFPKAMVDAARKLKKDRQKASKAESGAETP